MFKKKKPEGKTVLLLDVESGSVGAALVYLSQAQAPRLFGETREKIPLFHTRDTTRLTKELEQATQSVLQHTSEVAARMRTYAPEGLIGEPTKTFVLLHPPWSYIQFNEEGTPVPAAAEEAIHFIHKLHDAYRGGAPVSYHAFGASIGSILPTVYGVEGTALILNTTGELSELLLIERGRVVGYATIPFGTHSLVRTLQTHAGFSVPQALSALKLMHSETHEALGASQAHFAQEFSDAVHQFLNRTERVEVFVIAQEPFGRWFAHSLTHTRASSLFESGGVVRAVSPHHLFPYIAAHAKKPDTLLMLGSLFADARFSSI